MSAPILATKLYIPPLQPKIVSRARLIERLNGGLQNKPGLTLISASAGFGKTTLISDWINNSRFTNDALRLVAPKEDQIGNPKSKIQNRTAWLGIPMLRQKQSTPTAENSQVFMQG